MFRLAETGSRTRGLCVTSRARNVILRLQPVRSTGFSQHDDSSGRFRCGLGLNSGAAVSDNLNFALAGEGQFKTPTAANNAAVPLRRAEECESKREKIAQKRP